MDALCEDYENEVFDCKVKFCDDLNHVTKLNDAYDFIVSALKTASDHLIRENNHTMKKIPGWNSHCKTLHNIARIQYITWVKAGKPRDNNLFIDMKHSRSQFKNALSFCKRNELKLCKQNLADKFINKNKSSYWQEIKKFNTKSKNMSNCIDGLTNYNEIIKCFENKYKDVLDNSR